MSTTVILGLVEVVLLIVTLAGWYSLRRKLRCTSPQYSIADLHVLADNQIDVLDRLVIEGKSDSQQFSDALDRLAYISYEIARMRGQQCDTK
jgi:hypothetical protein